MSLIARLVPECLIRLEQNTKQKNMFCGKRKKCKQKGKKKCRQEFKELNFEAVSER